MASPPPTGYLSPTASRSPTPAFSPEAPWLVETLLEDDRNLAEGLRVHSSVEAVFIKFTPFVIALAAGNLSVDSFRHFISQGKNFLKAQSDAYASAGKLTNNERYNSLALLKLGTLRCNVFAEMIKHDSFLQEWGLDVTKDATPDPATANCTEFLLGKGVVNLTTPLEQTIAAIFTVGALTPSVQICPFLAAELRMLPGFREDSHPYRNWIKMYTSESHQELAVKTEELLDELSVNLTEGVIDVLSDLYRQTMLLGIDFFNSLPFAQPTVVPVTKGLNSAEDRLMVLSDFNLTCTVHDSSTMLADMALVTAVNSLLSPSESPLALMSWGDLQSTWEEICNQYTQEYEECIESIIPSERVEFNHSSLVQALEQVADFEKRANTRVIESGVLRDLKLEDIVKAGESLLLQDGCISFYQKLAQINVDVNVHILSYCWCSDLIRSSLSSVGFDHSNVHSNELIFDEELRSTGEMVWKIESPIDKLQMYNHILEKNANKPNKLTVYVGYCVGDILCLLEADIGIVIGSSERLRRVGSRFGVTFVSLFAATVEKQEELTDGGSLYWKGTRSGILYTASSWTEIHAFLLGWEDSNVSLGTNKH